MPRQLLKLLLQSKHPLRDIRAFFVGNLRYNLYYSINWKWLIRKHIKQQIDYRIKVMNPLCYTSGACIKCGCQTTHLQMANRTCDGMEYPPIVSRKQWILFCVGDISISERDYLWRYSPDDNTMSIFYEGKKIIN